MEERRTDERRAFIRHPSEIPIELRAQVEVDPDTPRLRDVSLGGLCCSSTTGMETGTVITVRIPVVRPAFETRGRVVWCRRKNGEFDVGVEFLEPHDAFRARMVEQVCHIEQYRREISDKEGRELDSETAALEWIQKHAAAFPQIS